MLLHLSSHFKITSLSLTQGSTVFRLRPNRTDQHLSTCVVLYFEVSVGALAGISSHLNLLSTETESLSYTVKQRCYLTL